MKHFIVRVRYAGYDDYTAIEHCYFSSRDNLIRFFEHCDDVEFFSIIGEV